MPTPGGSLQTVLIVDICWFGVVTLIYGLWRLRTRRDYLRQILIYSFWANLAATVLGLLLLFEVSLKSRDDGVQVYWLRWLFYLLIYGLSGTTHAYAEVNGQEPYYVRWIASPFVGLVFLGPLFATLAAEQDQRILFLALAAIPYLTGVPLMWFFNRARSWISIVLLGSLTVGLLLYLTFYALGEAGWQQIPLFWESAAYLILDAVLISLMPALGAFFHCPHAVLNGACSKKRDAVEQQQFAQQQQQQFAQQQTLLAAHYVEELAPGGYYA